MWMCVEQMLVMNLESLLSSFDATNNFLGATKISKSPDFKAVDRKQNGSSL